ncbi:phage baseplate assembly protein V [Lysinibacillus sp. NPDC047702]|uniref:phage baseplate assembly protein V n=1 Tax=unclassified Lysinibacillus TaxID=2636778 RepID=UPI003D026277
MSKGGMENTPFETIRKGLVSSVNRKNCTVRVYFPDWDEKVSDELPVMQKNTLNTKYYWMPEVDEQVICAFFANGTEEGVVLGAIYSEADKVPQEFLESDDCDGVLFSDGTLIRYDATNHILLIDVKGEIEIKADKNIRAKSGEKIYLN